MLVSMTGFGSGRYESADLRISVEVRSVNHRYLELMIRLPKGYMLLEERVRSLVSRYVNRGRLEISVVIEDFRLRGRTVTLDSHLLKSYYAAVSEARELVPVEGEFSVSALLGVADLFQVQESPIDPESIWPHLSEALGQALHSVAAMRTTEGKRLQEDMLQRLDQVESFVEAVARRAPLVVEEYRNRLLQRIESVKDEVQLDEARIQGEILLMVDRSNIDEELVRARSHIEAFRTTCMEGGVVGRKLDFLLQEMNREVNTIGSKASDVEISGLVVQLKAELEKIREQVQNIE